MNWLHGADISRWQGTVNWDLLKQNFDFVIMKASGGDGGLYPDGQFARNKSEARRVGILHGFYHFAGGTQSPETEADQFVNTVGDLQKGEILVLDFEVSHADPVGFCYRFAKRVEARTGNKPLLYSNGARITGLDWLPLVKNDNGLWIASWGANNGAIPANQPSTGAWNFWAIWQYTSRGAAANLSPLDLDVFNGNKEQFQAYGGKEGAPAPAPTPAPVQPTPSHDVKAYVVTSRDYDGLAAAMKRIGISDWQAVARLNGLKDPYVIHAGDVLKLTSSATVTPHDGTYTVTARDADGLAAAMARIGITNWQAVAEHNGLHAPYVIHAGDVLKLPGGTPSTETSRAYYIVKPSDFDGLAAAMRRIGISNWQAVARLNGLKDPYVIHAGDKLWLN